LLAAHGGQRCRGPLKPWGPCRRPQADVSNKRLGRAGKLTALLGDEMARWQATADTLGARLALLPGDALLAAACICYTGAFTGGVAGGQGPLLAFFLAALKACPARLQVHAYVPSFAARPPPGPYRAALLDSWLARCATLGIPHTGDFTLAAALASPVELREWAIHGLPLERVSIDNGALVARGGGRWPLMIDPQEQGTRCGRGLLGGRLR
jgi:dynein heavy chain